MSNELLDDHTFSALAEQTDRSARESGALFALLFNLYSLAESDVRAGDLQNAAARHDESLDVALALGLPVEFYVPMRVDVHAWAGDEELTRSCASTLIQLNTAARDCSSCALESSRSRDIASRSGPLSRCTRGNRVRAYREPIPVYIDNAAPGDRSSCTIERT